MKVTVVDRESMNHSWGSPGFFDVIIKTVEISDFCPVCGEKRGEPELRNFCENGVYYVVHCWKNPCGHIDLYQKVIKEGSLLEKERESHGPADAATPN